MEVEFGEDFGVEVGDSGSEGFDVGERDSVVTVVATHRLDELADAGVKICVDALGHALRFDVPTNAGVRVRTDEINVSMRFFDKAKQFEVAFQGQLDEAFVWKIESALHRVMLSR